MGENQWLDWTTTCFFLDQSQTGWYVIHTHRSSGSFHNHATSTHGYPFTETSKSEWFIYTAMRRCIALIHRKLSNYLRRDGGMNFLGIDLTPPWRDDFFEYCMNVFISVNKSYAWCLHLSKYILRRHGGIYFIFQLRGSFVWHFQVLRLLQT